MSELLQSKKFLSAIIGVVLLIVVNFLFAEKPETVESLQYVILATFGLQITAQGLADFGKEKAKEERKKTEAEVAKVEYEAEIAKAAVKIPMPTPPPSEAPWEQ